MTSFKNGMFFWLAFEVPSVYICFYDHLKQNHKSGSESLKRPAFLLAFNLAMVARHFDLFKFFRKIILALNSYHKACYVEENSVKKTKTQQLECAVGYERPSMGAQVEAKPEFWAFSHGMMTLHLQSTCEVVVLGFDEKILFFAVHLLKHRIVNFKLIYLGCKTLKNVRHAHFFQC